MAGAGDGLRPCGAHSAAVAELPREKGAGQEADGRGGSRAREGAHVKGGRGWNLCRAIRTKARYLLIFSHGRRWAGNWTCADTRIDGTSQQTHRLSSPPESRRRFSGWYAISRTASVWGCSHSTLRVAGVRRGSRCSSSRAGENLDVGSLVVWA